VAGAESVQKPEGKSLSPAEDSFISGEYWRNRAHGVDNSGETGNALLNNALKRYGEAKALGSERDETSADSENIEKTFSSGEQKADGTPLTDEELREVALLKKIDSQVKAHEMAHLAVAGSYSRGGATFTYKRGPDGTNYAVGGEVQIDTSKEATPKATISKMQVVRAAALAPADPSPQDRKVAAAATAEMGQAQKEMQMQELDTRLREVQRSSGKEGDPPGKTPYDSQQQGPAAISVVA